MRDKAPPFPHAVSCHVTHRVPRPGNMCVARASELWSLIRYPLCKTPPTGRQPPPSAPSAPAAPPAPPPSPPPRATAATPAPATTTRTSRTPPCPASHAAPQPSSAQPPALSALGHPPALAVSLTAPLDTRTQLPQQQRSPGWTVTPWQRWTTPSGVSQLPSSCHRLPRAQLPHPGRRAGARVGRMGMRAASWGLGRRRTTCRTGWWSHVFAARPSCGSPG